MKRILTLLLFIIQCSLFTATAQDKHLIDSLETQLKKHDAAKKELGSKAPAMYDTTAANIYSALSYQYWSNNPDTAMYYAKQCLSVSEQIGFKKGIAKGYHNMGAVNQNKGNYSQALEYSQKALQLYEEVGSKKGMGSMYNSIGIIHYEQGNYPEALKNYFLSLKLYEEIGEKNGIAFSYNNIGLIYNEQGNYPEALKNYYLSLKIMEEMGNKNGIALSYNNIGIIYDEQGNYPDALKNYFLSLKIKEELVDKSGIALLYNNIGKVCQQQGHYPEALKNHFLSLKIKEEIGDKDGISSSYNNIGEVYEKQGNLQEALKYETMGLSLALEIGAKDRIELAYQELAVIDSAMGNYKGALVHYKLYTQVKDSMFNMENQKKISQLENAKKQVADSVKMADEKQLYAIEIKRQKQLKYGFIIGFALVMFFSLLIIKEKRRSDKLLLNILPTDVAKELKDKGSAEARDYQEVSVMFTDFKDFTKISEKMTPSELVKEIDFCFSAFDNIIHKHGIEKIKTIGDAYMCAGGLPVANKTHAEDTVKAAIEIRDFMANLNKEKLAKGELPFEIRIGINTGPVVAGIVGVKKFAYDIWGDTVNLASRMESSGEAGKVNISGSTYELVKDKFTCSHRGKIQTKNKGEVDMYFVS